MNMMIENVEHYHYLVKLRLIVLFEKNKMPDNVDEFNFVGGAAHSKTIEALLDFIEYLVIQSQNDSQQPNDFVSIGIKNINNLWKLFISEPNFNSD